MSQLLLAVKAEDVNVAPWMVVVLGLATVFVVLVCIIGICKLMSALMKKSDEPKKVKDTAPVAQSTAPVQTIPNKGEFVAAVSAAIAEELGTDVSAIRIHDIKKL